MVEITEPGRALGAELRDADEFTGRIVVRDRAVDALDPFAARDHFLRVMRRMLGARLVVLAPVGIDAERQFVLRLDQASHDVFREQDVGVAGDEGAVHQVLGAHQRDEDVVVGPVPVLAEDEVRIVTLHRVDAIAADEHDLGAAPAPQGLDGPVQDALALDLGKAFGGVFGGGHEPAATAGSDDDGAHDVRTVAQHVPSRQP